MGTVYVLPESCVVYDAAWNTDSTSENYFMNKRTLALA